MVMAKWCSESRGIFVGIYAVVACGVLLSGFFVLSSLPSGSSAFSSIARFLPSLPSATEEDGRAWNSTPALSANCLTSETVEKVQPDTDIWKRPRGSEMPNKKKFLLTKEMVGRRAKDNVIIVTFGNYAFMDFILTWTKHLTDLNVFNLLVGAMDTKLLKALYWQGIPVFDMDSKMITEDAGWGTKNFHKMGREKVILINAILSMGFELLMCDTDMVWLKNPLPYLARYPDADVLTSSDQVIPTYTDDGLEDWKEVSSAYNIGIFYWRPTDPAKRLAKEWKELLLSDDKIWDQNGFNDLIRKALGPSVNGESKLVYAYDGTLKLGVLPASIFCNGHTFFVQAMPLQLKLDPYAVHTTFQYAGTEGKRHRLREAKIFFDQPSYYDSPGGFLSFKPSIPKSLFLDGAHTLESHFRLVNHQLKLIRTALALASLSNRTLVMPPLWCRLDRLWYGHPGILEGTMTRQPFLCPMDHVFEVHTMVKDLPEEEFGPQIGFREYSFLENPFLPQKVRTSILQVQICDDGTLNCSVIEKNNKTGHLPFPRNSKEREFLDLFVQYKNVKVIEFSSMMDIFKGFSDPVRQAKFRNRVKRYVGIWCCVPLEIGHIYYDIFWDEKPGWKPKPPKNREEDHPPW